MRKTRPVYAPAGDGYAAEPQGRMMTRRGYAATEDGYSVNSMKIYDEFGGFPATHGIGVGSACMGCVCPCVVYGDTVNRMWDRDENRGESERQRPDTFGEMLKPSVPCMAFGCTCVAAVVGIQGWGVPFLSSSGWGSMMLGNVLEAKTLLNIIGYCIPQCMFALPLRRAVMAETEETCTASCCNVLVCPGCSLANLKAWSDYTEYASQMGACGSILPCCITISRDSSVGEESAAAYD